MIEKREIAHSDQTPPGLSAPGGDRGLCLCLSGGGFRATLFHLGAIQRLNELGILAQASTITSVSGGSILNGLLASRWSELVLVDGVFTNLSELVEAPMRQFCASDLRTRMVVGTRINPVNWPALVRDGFSISANFLAEGYEPLFGLRLRDVPQPGNHVPRFVFCATNVRTGACWHFHTGPKARMGDFYTGYCEVGDVRVSDAVAASSAFPFAFAALRLQLPAGTELSREDPWGEQRVKSNKRPDPGEGAAELPMLLADGGVYDNLGVEPVWNAFTKLLVSDAGLPFESRENCKQRIVSRLKRASDISMEQVGAVRKRWLVNELTGGRRIGALWSISSLLDDFPIADKRGYGADACKAVQRIRTDLDGFSEGEMACLQNHGYSLADAALRSRAPTLCPNPGADFRLPYDDWTDDRKVAPALAQSGTLHIWRDLVRYFRG